MRIPPFVTNVPIRSTSLVWTIDKKTHDSMCLFDIDRRYSAKKHTSSVQIMPSITTKPLAQIEEHKVLERHIVAREGPLSVLFRQAGYLASRSRIGRQLIPCAYGTEYSLNVSGA